MTDLLSLRVIGYSPPLAKLLLRSWRSILIRCILSLPRKSVSSILSHAAEAKGAVIG
jgi:hypothetical protein